MGRGGWKCPGLAQGDPARPIPVGCWTSCESPLPGGSSGPGVTQAVVSLANGSEEPAGMLLAGKGAFPLEPVTRGTVGRGSGMGACAHPKVSMAVLACCGPPRDTTGHCATALSPFHPRWDMDSGPGESRGMSACGSQRCCASCPHCPRMTRQGGTWGQMLRNELGKLPYPALPVAP